MCIMEQLAHFVTKSFEYNNNRVLDVINMSTKSICDNFLKTCESVDALTNGRRCGDSTSGGGGEGADNSDIDEDTMDIDITDLSSNDNDESIVDSAVATTTVIVGRKDCDSQNSILSFNRDSPLSLVKKSNPKDNFRHVTKNWLISDTPKKKYEGIIKFSVYYFLEAYFLFAWFLN